MQHVNSGQVRIWSMHHSVWSQSVLKCAALQADVVLEFKVRGQFPPAFKSSGSIKIKKPLPLTDTWWQRAGSLSNLTRLQTLPTFPPLFECSAGIPYMTVLNKESEGGKEGGDRRKESVLVVNKTWPTALRAWRGKMPHTDNQKKIWAWGIIQATGICACSLLKHLQITTAPSFLIPVYAVLKQGVRIILKLAKNKNAIKFIIFSMSSSKHYGHSWTKVDV